MGFLYFGSQVLRDMHRSTCFLGLGYLEAEKKETKEKKKESFEMSLPTIQ